MFSATLDFKGLQTYANNLGAQAPPGSCTVANNINGDSIGNAITRRGFDYYSSHQFSVASGYITKLFVYSGTLYASFNGGQFAQDNGSGTWTVYSGFTMVPPTNGFLHYMGAGGNGYFTTNNGIYKISGVNSTNPMPAGAPPALDTTLVVSGQIDSGFLDAQSQCAYSIVWGYTDAQNLLILGTPSNAAYAQNTQSSGSTNNANVTITFSIPPMVINYSSLPWFYQIYRTPNTGSLTVPPGNNYQLVAQNNPTSTDYTNHYVTYDDTTLDSLLTTDLYTDDGQPFAGLPYGQPPLAKDIAYFNSMAFYANFKTLQNVLLTLDSVGASLGLQVGDTIKITDSGSGTNYTYTGGSSNDPTTRTFAIYTSGTPAVNIQTTAQNIVSVINQDPNNALFTAQYTSGQTGLPGQMQLSAQNLSQAFFSIVSSRTTCWTPELPSSGTTYASANVSVPNGVMISPLAMPESAPPAYIEYIGSPNFPIERIIAVRTALIVLKPEEGCFIITGTSPTTLTIQTLDMTSFINGSETLVPLNNSGYFMSTQGVLLVNESGCQIMSRPIQADLLSLATYQFSNFPTLAFALGYQSDDAYILFLQKNQTDKYSTLQYRYNWITQCWTTWDKPCTAAVISTADDRMYIATPDGYILQERKTFSNLDFADETNSVTISAVGTNQLTLSSSVNTKIGDQISQTNSGNNYEAIVTSNNIDTGVIGVSSSTGFVTGSADDTLAINSTITYMPLTGGYPAFIKKFGVFNFEFNQIDFTSCTATFTTDFYPNSESVTLNSVVTGGWGTFPWGTTAWGVSNALLQPIATYATKNTAIGHWIVPTINLQEAYSGFSISGFTASYEFYGFRNK